MNILQFLRDVGKQFRLSAMLRKESVQLRLHGSNSSAATNNNTNSSSSSSSVGGGGEADAKTDAAQEGGEGAGGEAEGGEGMSFTEFSYQTLQAYDFLHLYRTSGCRVQ